MASLHTPHSCQGQQRIVVCRRQTSATTQPHLQQTSNGYLSHQPGHLLAQAWMIGMQVENVECLEDDHIKFDFLGKDSIRYENEVVVHPKVHALVKKFCQQTSDKKGELPWPAPAWPHPTASKTACGTGLQNQRNLRRLR